MVFRHLQSTPCLGLRSLQINQSLKKHIFWSLFCKKKFKFHIFSSLLCNLPILPLHKNSVISTVPFIPCASTLNGFLHFYFPFTLISPG